MFIGKSNMAVAVTFQRERLPTTSVLWDHALPQHLCCGLGSLTSLKLWVCGMWEKGVYKPSSRNSGVTSDFAFVMNTRTLNWFAYYYFFFFFFFVCVLIFQILLSCIFIPKTSVSMPRENRGLVIFPGIYG